MNARSLPGLFVTGTDTGVGKTHVAAAIVARLIGEGRRIGALKPAASGCERRGDRLISEDAELLLRSLGDPSIPIERVNPIALEAPLAPNVAARIAGGRLLRNDIEVATRDALNWWSDRSEGIVVEGVGGFLCPLAEGTTAADLAIALDFPVLIVARLGLGTLNHTLLTVEAVKSRALRVAGVVLNSAGPPEGSLAEATNPEELSARLPSDVPLLALLPYRPEATGTSFQHGLIGCYHWMDRPRTSFPTTRG